MVVTSTDHFRGEINWDDVNFKLVSKNLPYDPAKAYYQSKLANLMHANHLTTKLQGTGISVFAVHPGMVGVFGTKAIYSFMMGPPQPLSGFIHCKAFSILITTNV